MLFSLPSSSAGAAEPFPPSLSPPHVSAALAQPLPIAPPLTDGGCAAATSSLAQLLLYSMATDPVVLTAACRPVTFIFKMFDMKAVLLVVRLN